MESIKTQTVLGLMSSYSLDGVKAALLTTDGVDVFASGPAVAVPYEETLRDRLRAMAGRRPQEVEADLFHQLETDLTEFHAQVVKDFIRDYDAPINLIGFYGHTLCLIPQERYICQLGNGAMLSSLTGIPVVNRFCAADLAAGGKGDPLSASYHNALTNKFEKPLAILNISGITSVTWIGTNGELLAFDTGPGNAPINDWVLKHGGQHMDYNGKLAITGQIDGHVLASMMRHKYFGAYPPKSCARDLFKDKLEHLEGLSLADGAATATAFVAESIAYSLALYLPELPSEIIVCGGGAKNPSLMRFLRQRLEKVEVKTAAELGWPEDMVETQAIAYLAVRRLNRLPASFPGTTGVPEPVICGEVHYPAVE